MKTLHHFNGIENYKRKPALLRGNQRSLLWLFCAAIATPCVVVIAFKVLGVIQ